MKEVSTRFDHNKEDAIYRSWEESGKFEPSGEGEPYSIILPPPNVTGDLHLGHALTYSLQDVMARHQRRLGKDVLVLPGADHAAIAVQALVEKKVQKEHGLSRTHIGRERFLEEVWNWIEHYMPRMRSSLKRLGLSADWKRFRFTMDEHSQHAVTQAFVKLYKQGLIYRGTYLINWDPKLQTAISDDEVNYQETDGHLYWIKYGPITVATTRPETKLGDVAIAVHPKDARYREFVGKEIEFTNELGEKQKLPVISDEIVDMEFGTGALKVTPAHDATDWELGQKHRLPTRQVINQFGKMADGTGPYANLKREEAREKIVEDLKELGLLEKVTDHKLRQPISERSGAVIEPLPSTQWFLKTTALKDKASSAVKEGKITFQPKSIEKVYFHWLENLHDWCISRQLWWGHAIPAWYDENGNVYVAESAAEAQKEAGANVKLTQDSDVLDTWFSSGLWPFSTLGWPNSDSADLKRYFPTSFLETGADILFFWVARMIMLSEALVGDVPFRAVYFHGLVLDEHGQKMSKSKGNVLDPLSLIEKYGADALRMSLIGGNTPGQAQRFSEQKILKYRNFVTKIWNASRFVCQTASGAAAKLPNELDPIEQKFLDQLGRLEKHNQKHFNNFHFNLALEELYNFFWNDFASDFLEYEKQIIRESNDPERMGQAKAVLLTVLERQVELLSDFAPFVCYEIKQEMLNE